MALNWPLAQIGAAGENVRSIQYLLTAHGYPVTVDGDFGPLTKAAVERLQSARGLAVDGIVGQQSWPQLIIQVHEGASGYAVRAVQSQLHSRGDPNAVAVDGVFGPITDQAVRGFQQLASLTVDGIVGPNTWNTVVNGYFTAPNPKTAATRTFNAWSQHNEAVALKNGTQIAVGQLFAQTFSASDGWSFDDCQGALGHTYCSWRRPTGQELRIGVENAVVAPVYAVDNVQFT
jgi:peptidoglycan hydrolase-like protein with peptidoglycan-binding domain